MKKRAVIALALVLLAALPLAGGIWRGLSETFFSFPPLIEHEPPHAPFSAPVFAAIAALCGWAILFFAFPRRFGFSPPPAAPPPAPGRFPLHGRIGLWLMLAAWICAWSRCGLPQALAAHTFFPLWLGFIFTVDGWVFRRTGDSLFSNHRPTFWALFPASALSWWYFELLNRLVLNWWYEIPMPFGPAHYLIYSSLCFSTVLPAVFGIRAWLASFPALRVRYSCGPRLRIPGAGAVFAACGLLVLPLLPLYPDPLFFLVWIAPLALLAGALGLVRIPTPFDAMKRGDWSPVLLLALSALICGFFWELWNFGSSPRWAYSVPYVNRFHLFEMPAVGYFGYLPFGPVCACFWLAWTTLLPVRWQRIL
jgi:hypothetical protein